MIVNLFDESMSVFFFSLPSVTTLQALSQCPRIDCTIHCVKKHFLNKNAHVYHLPQV